MRRDALLASLLTLVIAVPAPVRAAGETGGADAVVYVGRNGACYHQAGCPRLRFAAAMPLQEAQPGHRPCPVCLGAGSRRAKQELPEGRVAAPLPALLGPVAPAPEDARAASAGPDARAAPPAPQVRRSRPRHGRAFHAAIGSLIGFGAGFALGYALESAEPPPPPCRDLLCFRFAYTPTETGLLGGILGAGVGAFIGGAMAPAGKEVAHPRAGANPGRQIELDPELIARSFALAGGSPGEDSADDRAQPGCTASPRRIRSSSSSSEP